jgi:hypothetical protein
MLHLATNLWQFLSEDGNLTSENELLGYDNSFSCSTNYGALLNKGIKIRWSCSRHVRKCTGFY